jgi:hypothetical protein
MTISGWMDCRIAEELSFLQPFHPAMLQFCHPEMLQFRL